MVPDRLASVSIIDCATLERVCADVSVCVWKCLVWKLALAEWPIRRISCRRDMQ